MKGKQLTTQEIINLKDGTKVWLEKMPYLENTYDQTSKVYIVDSYKFTCENHKGFYIHKDGIAISRGHVKVYEWKEDVKMNNIETILNELKAGDLVYIDHTNLERKGWYILTRIGLAGLNTKNLVTNTFSCENTLRERYKHKQFLKYIKINEVGNSQKFAEFLHNFDETRITEFIYTITYKTEKEVKLEALVNELSTQLDNAKKQLEEVRGM